MQILCKYSADAMQVLCKCAADAVQMLCRCAADAVISFKVPSNSTTTTTTTPEPTTPELTTQPTTELTDSSDCNKCEQGCQIENNIAICFCYQGYKTGCNDDVCDRDKSVKLPDFSSDLCPDTVYKLRVGRRSIKQHTISWKKIGDYSEF